MKNLRPQRINHVLGIAILFILVFSAFNGGTAMASSFPLALTPTPPPPPVRVPFEPNPMSESFSANAISGATAQQLALAMDVPNGDIVAADLMGSDALGVGVGDAGLGEWFPTKGSTFAILSTGQAANASQPDSTGNLSTTLGGINNQQGNDLVRLHLQLRVPSDINCLNVDYAFYSEEFPEWVGSQFNDRFTAQLNDSSLSIAGNEVVAPGNFAFDINNNVISVNTVFGVHGPTGTTYDGVTPRLRARTAVVPNAIIDMYLSIQDLGDSIYDSSVFLDNFFWSKDPVCEGGSQADSDGDGLMDGWEVKGLTVSAGGVNEFVDLPAMGADPLHKDIFVEIDYMGSSGLFGHTHKPSTAAIKMIVNAFNNAPVNNPDGKNGIHLHVDYGSNAPLPWGKTAKWGTLSHSDQLTHVTNLGTANGDNYDWSALSTIKQDHFTPGRAAVFHYNVWAHNLAPAFGGTSGISRNSLTEFGSGASDFIVSLGSWTGGKGSNNEQAGTFMHELGHNLGLRHGGEDHNNWKPNYLSVMNYSMQSRGLILNGTAGNFDYSRYDLADLDENSLDETAGINIPGSVSGTLGTYYFCGLDDVRQDTDASAADWNCDGDQTDTSVSRNINEGMSWNSNGTMDPLTSQNDWDHLVYSGGAISQPGAIVSLPQESQVIDIDQTNDSAIPNSLPVMNTGSDTTGVFRPVNGLLYLKNKNETGFADAALNYGLPGDYPIVGDWDGNGTSTIGVYRNGYFYLKNANTLGFADIVFTFGKPGDQPIAGDWNGDGTDTIGVYRPYTGQFLLRNSNDEGLAEISFYLGNVGDVGIAGDWDGDGIDTTGVFRPSNGVIFMKNTNDTGFADIALNYGLPGDKPVMGDWNNDGIDTIGIYRNGTFYLRNENTNGFAEIVFGLGNPGDVPIASNWDGIP